MRYLFIYHPERPERKSNIHWSSSSRRNRMRWESRRFVYTSLARAFTLISDWWIDSFTSPWLQKNNNADVQCSVRVQEMKIDSFHSNSVFTTHAGGNSSRSRSVSSSSSSPSIEGMRSKGSFKRRSGENSLLVFCIVLRERSLLRLFNGWESSFASTSLRDK